MRLTAGSRGGRTLRSDLEQFEAEAEGANHIEPATPRPTSRRLLWIGAAAAVAGLTLGAAGIASAQSSDSSTTATGPSGTEAPAAPDAGTDRPDPARRANGPGETLLTGDTAAKVEAAALAAVPGSTVVRVETDAQGAAYEAHLREADGTYVTVTFDESFQVVETLDGFGGPGGGPGGHERLADEDATTATTTG